MSFVTLTKEQFENILKEFVIVNDPRSQEYIYDLPTSNYQINVRIYSTVDKRTNITRDIGKDAIRIVFWDKINNRPIGKGKKILRVEAATKIEDRIKRRINEFMLSARSQTIVDFEYVKAVLNHEAVNWMDFAQNLSDKLDEYGSLTDGQLAYVLGNNNPKGKLTFEARVKMKDPNFFENYMMEESDNEECIEETETESIEEREEENIVDEKAEETESRNKDMLVSAEQQKSWIEKRPVEPSESGLINTLCYKDWNYPFDYFNPVQSETLQYVSKDVNVILSANTSAGKTICAEFFIDDVFKKT